MIISASTSNWKSLRREVRDTFVSYAEYYVESFRLPGTAPEVLDAGFSYEGWQDVLDARVAAGDKGVIVALPPVRSTRKFPCTNRTKVVRWSSEVHSRRLSPAG